MLLQDLGLRRRRLPPAGALPVVPAPPAVARETGPTGREALGDAAQPGTPGDVLAEALLRLLGDGDALPPRLVAEASDAAGRRALLLFGRGAGKVSFRQRA